MAIMQISRIHSRSFSPVRTNHKRPSTIIPMIVFLVLFTGSSLFPWLRGTERENPHSLWTEPSLSSDSGTDTILSSSPSWISQASSGTWLCTLPSSEEGSVRPRIPVVVLSDARTGSNFFFGLLRSFHRLTADSVFDLLPLYEAFNQDKEEENLLTVRVIADVIRGCHLSYQSGSSPEALEAYLLHDAKLHDREELSRFLHHDMKATEWDIIQPVLTAVQQRFADPIHFIRTITRIPQHSTRPYFVLKIFPNQFDDMRKTPSDFISAMNDLVLPVRGTNNSESGVGTWSPHQVQFLVAYRRRIIEMFVSFKIAEARGQWINAKATSRDAITLSKQSVEYNIRQKTTYFTMIRTALDANGTEYHVFEYARDLMEPGSQMKTVHRLKEILHVPIADSMITEDNFLSHNLQKQAQAPLSDLVDNWEDVIEWGYAGEVDEWEDLFPNK